MADFKTTLKRLSRGEIEFDAVARNIDKLLSKKPQAAVAVMDQLKQAVGDGLIDAETYARLKSRVTSHVEAAPLGDSVDRTQFGGDSTEMRDAARNILEVPDDGTEILDITGGGSAALAGIDFDLSTGSRTSPSWPTGGTQTGQTGTDWAQPQDSAAVTRIASGSVLRGRFQLDEVLGVGGMGSVYLARDLIKVRAKDKQPRVALKVLNEDFKQHPDSFIALQREASRQQKLAHPNIATVYDFDQTEDGLAFLVMELLEGQPLNEFIKKIVKQKGGLPFTEALPMVQGLGAALVYAHERSIVHSDFKPGNCFLTRDGQMKVLDFGIARAVKNPGAAEGETTIFDAGKLGALTPAYASTEMLEGEEPDPRDDIYALACVTYELLSGKHPFNKIPANKARDSGLEPEPIKGLTRKQWRGLARGLAFSRDQRSQTTAQFLEEFEGKTSPWKNPFVVLPAAAALIAAVSIVPIMNMLDRRDTESRIAMAQSGDPRQIEAVLAGLTAGGLDSSKVDRILNEAKEKILAYFDQAARARIDTVNGLYDFNGARLMLEQARAYSVYTDSTKLKELEEYIGESENRLMNEQFEKFNAALESGSLLAVDGEDDIHDAMAVVAQVHPGHPLLKDRRLPGAFATAINAALENDDFDYADNLSTVGLDLIGQDNANLVNLADKIGGERERAETAARILGAIDAIQKTMESGEGLAGYLKIQNAVVDLAALDPGNPLLDAVHEDVEPRAARDLAALERSKRWGESELMLGDYSRMLRALGLHDINGRSRTLNGQFTTEVNTLRNDVTRAVAADELAPDAQDALERLAALAPRNENTQNARDQIAKAWLQDARLARDAADFDAGSAALTAARALTPSTPVLERIESEAATQATARSLDPAARDAAMAARKAAFDAGYPAFSASIPDVATDPGAIAAALLRLDELRALSPADARIDEATTALADAVQRSTDALGQAGQWDEAVALARQALIDLPQSGTLGDKLSALEDGRKQAIIESEKQLVADAKQAIEALLENATGNRAWRADVRRRMGDITAFGDPDDPWTRQTGVKIAETYIRRAAEMRTQQRLAEGANLIADAERYAPETPGLAAERDALAAATEAFEREQAEQARLARIDGLKQTFETQARANDVANASKTLDVLRQELSDTSDAFVTQDAPRLLAAAYYKLATTRAAATDYAAALRFAKACAELQPQRAECKLAVRDYTVDGNKQDLQKTFSRAGEFDVAEVLAMISEVQVLDPGVFSTSEGAWAQAVASRLDALKESAGTGANEAIDRAREVFAGNQLIAAIEPVRLTVAPSRYAAEVNQAMDKALLGVARDLLKKASDEEAEHPDIVRLKGAYNARVNDAKELYETYKKQYTAKDYEAALGTMDKAIKVWADSSTFKKEYARVVAKLGEIKSDAGPDVARLLPPALPPTDPCDSKLAGHGKRKKGTCFYFVSGNERGPLMVVVPAGDAFTKPFAIGKFEIMVGDYNRYCRLSGACQPITGQEARLPVTGISLEQATAYVTWLSERTGQKFRLPTAAEWTYAAGAAGQQPKKDYNCRVEQGGQLLKGQGTMGVNTGKANGWGLYNYVGNVQEWVTSGGSIVARGGAFEDAFSKCDISLEKTHDGSADDATGFRVLLELS